MGLTGEIPLHLLFCVFDEHNTTVIVTSNFTRGEILHTVGKVKFFHANEKHYRCGEVNLYIPWFLLVNSF